MITALIEALREIGSEPSADEISEALWLLSYVTGERGSHVGMSRPPEEIYTPLPKQALESDEIAPTGPTPNPKSGLKSPAPNIKAAWRQASGDLVLRTEADGHHEAARGIPLKIPATSALPGTLELARALRPLRRRVASRVVTVIDEEATARRGAEDRILMPVFKPATTRWLAVDLVVDTSASMIAWHRTVVELHRLIRRCGAFRDVRAWRLETDTSDRQLRLYSGLRYGQQNSTLHSFKELVDQSSRRLIILVSDCISVGWRSGRVTQLLSQWTPTNPVVLVQMLPKRFWQRSILGDQLRIDLHGSAPGLPNARLDVRVPVSWARYLDIPSSNARLPVITLEPKSLGAWARVLGGGGNAWVSGYILDPAEQAVPDGSPLKELTPDQRVSRFIAESTSLARELALLLAPVTPINLPVIRLICETMLPGAMQPHVAEVLTGGLLRQLRPREQINDPDELLYDFVPGVRDRLLKRAPLSRSEEVINRVSTFIAQHLHQQSDFLAMVAVPGADVRGRAIGQTPAFAKMYAALLRSKGYEDLAEVLEQVYKRALAQLDGQLSQETILLPPPPKPQQPPNLGEFVGRAAELEIFASRLATSHLAVIVGPAGVGKTALASQLARQVGTPGQIFWHSFHNGETVDSIIWGLAAFLAWNGQSELWQQLQSTRQTGVHPPPDDIVINYLLQMLQGRHYLLCFDDLHFITNDATLTQFVDRLLALARAGDIALVLISRQTLPFADTAGFSPVSGLTPSDVRTLMAKRELVLSDQLIDQMVAMTEGNAQLLLLSIEIISQASDPAMAISQLAVAPNIQAFVLTQVDQGLGQDEREVMQVIAFLGSPTTEEGIHALLGPGDQGQWDAEKSQTINRPQLTNLQLRQILHTLLDRNLLVSSGNEEREYGQHPLIKSFYYDNLSRSERAEFHRRASYYYEREQPDMLKAALHAHRASDYSRAADLLTSNVPALINLGQAQPLRALVDEFDSRLIDSSRWLAICLARGEVNTLLGYPESARAAYQEAFDRLEILPVTQASPILYARVCRGLGTLLEHQSPKEALDWLHRGLERLGASDPREETLLHLQIGSALLVFGDYSAARAALVRSMRLLPEGQSPLRATVLTRLGVVEVVQGNIKDGLSYYEQARLIYQVNGNRWGMMTLLSNIGIEKQITGDWGGASADYQSALELAEQLGDVAHQATLQLSLGVLNVQQGHPEIAQKRLSRCIELARAHNLHEYLVAAQSSLADLAIRQEEWEAAEALLREAEQLANEIGFSYQLPEIYRGVAQVRLAIADPQQALAYAERSVVSAQEIASEHDKGISLRILGQVLLANSRRLEALEAFAQSLQQLDGHNPYEAALTRCQWGAALQAAGDNQTGVRLLREARTVLAQLGAQGDLIALDRIAS